MLSSEMFQITKYSTTKVCIILFVSTYILFVDATTYQLNYEGIVSPHQVRRHTEKYHKKNTADMNIQLLPPTIAEETIATMGTKLFQFWIKKKYSEGEKVFNGQQLPMDFNCFPGGSQKCHHQSTICVMDYASSEFSFKIFLEIFQAEGNWEDYFDNTDGIDDSLLNVGNEVVDKSDSFLKKRIPIALRVDSIITTLGTDARLFLIESVPVINDSIEGTMTPSKY